MKYTVRAFSLIFALIFLSGSAAFADFEFSDVRFQGEFTTENLDRIIEEYDNVYNRQYYVKGMYGCRWNSNIVLPESPRLGRGECFGFASFIGYLLSGEYNPHGRWKRFYSLKASGGVRVGDIIRTDFEVNDIRYQHSAVVYSVSDVEIVFLQLSGSLYNKIILNEGFCDGYHPGMTTMEELEKLPNIRICRSQLNLD